MPTDGTRQKLVVSGVWVIAARWFERVIGFISISVLARLLQPADFGIIAVAGTVIGAISLLGQFGFDWALVQHRNPSPSHLNTAWTLRIILGACVFGALALVGPWAAAFYHQKSLKAILVVLGFSGFVGSFENIGTVYFRREFSFEKEFLLRTTAKLAGFATSLTIAIIYRSYWALVLGGVAVQCGAVLTSYAIHPYRPWFSLRRAKELFGFSFWILVGNVAGYFEGRFSDLYLGRVYGAMPTGLFAVAGQIAIMPITEIASPINRVAYSKYTEDVRANRDLKSSYLAIASVIWAIALPLSVGAIVVAPELVGTFLGSRWYDAVPVLRLLALEITFTVMASNTHYVYWALGHSRIPAALRMFNAAMIVPLTIIGSHLVGYIGVAWALAIESVFIAFINFLLLRRISGIRFILIWKRVWRVVLGSALMLVALYLIFPNVSERSTEIAAKMLLLKVVAGALIYVITVLGAWWLTGRPKGPEIIMLEFLRDRIGHGRRGQAADGV